MIKLISNKVQTQLLLWGAIFLSSCQDQDIAPPSDESASQEFSVDYAISQDSALAYLNEFLCSENPESRSRSIRKVTSIVPIKYPNTLSRSAEDSIECENLVYIANFENEQGFAVLAADKRISDKVIAIADSGQLKKATVNSSLSLVGIEKRPILPGYPTTGPGFVTFPEYGDEVFMNPNTVSMYNKEVNDTLVGDFRFDDIGAEDEMGNPIEGQENTDSPELLASTLCVNYAINEIQDYENERKNFQIANNDNIRVDDGGGISHQVRYEYSYSDWTVKKITSNILYSYRFWHQHEPFNSLYPRRRKYVIFGHRRLAPAGCFPLAIAKVLTHFKHPDVVNYNDYTVNWNALRIGYPKLDFEESAASLLRLISQGCDCWYFYKGTFTFPKNALSFMKQIGIPEVHKRRYNFDLVSDMIDKGKPIIIYAIPGINIFSSHCWNIDGYKIKERAVTVKHYIGNALQKTTTGKETCKMVHCDFGWKTLCNGYYVSGVFKLNDQNSEKDNPNDNGKKTKYNTDIRIIIYDIP